MTYSQEINDSSVLPMKISGSLKHSVIAGRYMTFGFASLGYNPGENKK